MKNISFSKESELKNILGRGGLAAFMLHFLKNHCKTIKTSTCVYSSVL